MNSFGYFSFSVMNQYLNGTKGQVQASPMGTLRDVLRAITYIIYHYDLWFPEHSNQSELSGIKT